jgi:hypothetical protein
MDPILTQTNSHLFERPLFAPSVERDSHRDTTAECGEYERVRIWSGVFTTDFERFISNKRVAGFIPNFVLEISF